MLKSRYFVVFNPLKNQRYEARMGCPAPYQGDFKRKCVSPMNIRHTHPKSQALAWQICHIAEIDWDTPITKLTEPMLEQLADIALRRFPDLCDSHFREIAIKDILKLQCSYKRMRYEIQLLGEEILGAPFPYKLNISRRHTEYAMQE